MTFAQWLDTLVDEKGYDRFQWFEVEGPVWGLNLIMLADVIEVLKLASPQTQAVLKNSLVFADLIGADLLDLFKAVAQEMAL